MHQKIHKAYTVGYVIEHHGENVEPPIFTELKIAISYFEEVVVKRLLPNIKFIRDDSVLDDNELARWYELRPIQLLKDNKVTYSENISHRSDNYWRVFKRDIVYEVYG